MTARAVDTSATDRTPSDDAEQPVQELVRECLEGNQDAWAALIDKYKRLIYSIPLRYGLSAEDASDVFQDVCVELLNELPRLRNPRALPKWLMLVTVHRCVTFKRHAQVHARMAESEASATDGTDTSQQLLDEMMVDVEREQVLRDAVAALPPRCRRLVDMLFFETPARPYRTIAAELRIACGSIGFIRGRCLQRLRVELQKHGFL